MADEFEQYRVKNKEEDEFSQYAVKEKKKEEEYQPPKWQDIFAKSLQNPEARIGMQPGVAEARETPIGQALELPLYLAAPEIGLPRLGAAAAKYLPRAGKYLTSAIQNALPQAGIAGGMSALSGENPLTPAAEAGAIAGPFSAASQMVLSGHPVARTIGRLGLGAGAGAIGYGASQAAGSPEWLTPFTTALAAGAGFHGFNPKRRAHENVLKGVEGKDYQSHLKAAEELGITHLTPAEASRSRSAGRVQGSLGTTPEGEQVLFNAHEKRAESEKKAIETLKDTIFNPGKHEAEKKAFYDVAYSKSVPPEKLAPFKENENFKQAEKEVLKNSAYKEKLKGIPKNSIEYLDMIKRNLGDKIEFLKIKGKKTEAGLIENTQKKLVDEMDKISPEYAQGRAIAERGFARDELEGFFKKKHESMNAQNFGKYLNNNKTYEELQHQLRNVPEAQKQLQNMKLILHNMIGTPNHKAAAAQSGLSMSKARSTLQAAQTKIDNFLTHGKFDKYAAELITNPKWAEEMEKLKKVTKREELIGKFIDLAGKAGGEYFSQKK